MATTYWKTSLATLQAITGDTGDRAGVTDSNGIVTFYYWNGSSWVESPVATISAVDATLSGTPKIFTIYDGTTPYYFKAYPTKA